MYASAFFKNPFLVSMIIVFMMAGIAGTIFIMMADSTSSGQQMSIAAEQLSYDTKATVQAYRNQAADYKTRNNIKEIGDKIRDSGD